MESQIIGNEYIKDMIARDIKEKKRTNMILTMIAVIGVMLFVAIIVDINQALTNKKLIDRVQTMVLENKKATLENRQVTLINRRFSDSILQKLDSIKENK